MDDLVNSTLRWSVKLPICVVLRVDQPVTLEVMVLYRLPGRDDVRSAGDV